MLKIIQYNQQINGMTIDVTSRSGNWSRGLSPFLVGPVKLYGDYASENVENAWQFSKVYSFFAENGEPTEKYFEWAANGWNTKRGIRHPMGKERPLYSYWDGEKLGYIEARKRIYIPLYMEAVRETQAFKMLSKVDFINQDVYLKDFDGYDHKALGMTYKDVVNDSTRIMGHGFVLGMMLENECVESF